MAREQVLLQAFVGFAERLTDDCDAVGVAADLATSCVDLFAVAEAGIMIAEADGSLRYLASSSERMQVVELFELQMHEGPCLDAYRTGHIIRCADAAGAGRAWPRFAPLAHTAGLRAFTAVPMRLRGQVIGALNLFSPGRELLDEHDEAVVQAFADIASIAIMQERAVRDARAVASQLQEALDSRIVIEQAKGVVAARSRIGIDQAFADIRAYSRRRHELLTDVARRIVDRSLDPDALRRSDSK